MSNRVGGLAIVNLGPCCRCALPVSCCPWLSLSYSKVMAAALFYGVCRYRGRVLNRASRIAGIAKTGQVWASEDAWNRCISCINEPQEGFGVLSHAQATLRLREELSGSLEAQNAANNAACQAAHTGRTVSAALLPAERLKGVNEEVGQDKQHLHCNNTRGPVLACLGHYHEVTLGRRLAQHQL